MRLYKDLIEFSGGESKKMIATIFLNPCFHCVALYRLSNLLYRVHLNILAKIVWYFNRIIYNADIDYRADLAGGFVLVHGLGCVIGRGVISKGKLKVYQGVTIGGTGKFIEKDNEKIWMPIIGDDVTIYTDAKVFGPIYIADGSIIKANSVVTNDINK
jgi:serine O-acetyltransferase